MTPSNLKKCNVALTAAVIIAYELNLIQLFGIFYWGYLTYFVISLALLGFGVSGIILSFLSSITIDTRERLFNVSVPATSFAIIICTSISFSVFNTLNDSFITLNAELIGHLILLSLLTFAPFLVGALVTGLALTIETERVNSIYSYNLLGSGVGGLLFISLSFIIPPHILPLLLAVLILIPSMIYQLRTKRYKQCLLQTASLLLLIIILPGIDLKVSEYKAVSYTLTLPGSKIESVDFTPEGMIHTISTPAVRYAKGGSLLLSKAMNVSHKLFLNGNEKAVLIPSTDEMTHIAAQTTSAIPFQLNTPHSVLFVEPTSNVMIDYSHATDLTRIDAIIPHSLAADAISNSLTTTSGISIHETSLRSFLEDDDSSYDIIQLPDTNSYGGYPAKNGSYADYIYTTETINQLYNRLTKNGILTFRVWHESPERTIFRSINLLKSALGSHNNNLSKHCIVVANWSDLIVLVFKNPPADHYKKELETLAERFAYDVIYADVMKNDLTHNRQNLYLDIQASLNSAGLTLSEQFELNPPSILNPHFHKTIKINRLPSIIESFGCPYLLTIAPELTTYYLGFIIVTLLALVLIILPLILARHSFITPRKNICYFSSIALGFMSIEIALIELSKWYLNNTFYALATVLSALMIGAGIGSQRYKANNKSPQLQLLITWLVTLFVLIPCMKWTMGGEQLLKSGIVITAIVPLSIHMGKQFPAGLIHLAGNSKASISLAWGVNGVLSVVSSIGIAIVFFEFGLVPLLLAPLLFYSISFVILKKY